MFNKKGDAGFPIYMPFSIAALILILLTFSILFFALGFANSSALVVGGVSYQDSMTLINLLKTEIQLDSNKMVIADAINLASKSEENSNKVKNEIDKILLKLPKPNKGTSYWYLEVKTNNKFLEAGSEAELGTKYLTQELTLPLENKQLVYVKLYLSCRSCNSEGVEALS